MDDPRWLRIITVGLVLAALVVVYYLLNGAFSLNKAKPQTQVTKTVQPSSAPNEVAVASSNPAPIPVASSKPTASVKPSTPTGNSNSAYNTIIARNQGKLQTLPKTGLPLGAVALLSCSIMIIGLGLRKFPN